MNDLTSSRSLKVVCYEPDIAQNLGTTIRLCACFGVKLVIIEPCGFPFSSRALKRSSLDYAEFADVSKYKNFESFCLDHVGSRLILLTTKTNRNIWDFSFKSNDVLVMGSETSGVSELVAQKVDAKLVIPMPGGGRSLNVAVSTGIALGEATRQLRSVS